MLLLKLRDLFSCNVTIVTPSIQHFLTRFITGAHFSKKREKWASGDSGLQAAREFE